jgi:hypothetical protein
MINSESYIKRNKEVFASEIDDEVVMMHVDTGKYYGMDTVGSRIWELIAEEIQVREVINKLMEEYDVEEEQCEKDVLEFLNELYDNKLVSVTK